jgi:glutamate/aspartate transport system substrate-binding protein
MKLLPSVLSAAVAATLLAAPAFAQESATLKKIKDTGSITLGHRESSIPFSYYDDKQQVIGFSHEIMLKVVDAVKENLKLAKIDTVPSISSAARRPTTPNARSRSPSPTPSSSSAPS